MEVKGVKILNSGTLFTIQDFDSIPIFIIEISGMIAFQEDDINLFYAIVHSFKFF